MTEVRPIHLPGSSAVSALLQRTRAALAPWAREWVSGGAANVEQRFASLQVESACAADLRRFPEFEGLQGANGHVWFRRGAADRSSFCHAIFGPELMPRATQADDWIADIAEHAWTVRNRAICEALAGVPNAAPSPYRSEWPASLSSYGSGAVKIFCEPLGLYAIADAGVWTRVPPAERKSARLPALVPLDRAAQCANVRVEVLLGSVELELPKLMDLRRGDVLRLPERLDRPLTVSCAGKPFARAVLGDAAGRKSVQIAGKYQ